MAVWIPPSARPGAARAARYFVAISSVAANSNIPTENTGTARVARDILPAIEILSAARRDD